MSTSPWALAVDFGTSRSAGAMAAEGTVTALEVEGNRWMPSLVLADPAGRVLVGTAADNQAGVHPDRVERTPKRHLGGPALVLGSERVEVADAVAALLRVFLDEGRLRRGGQDPAEVVLTHPVRWADGRKAALVDAARRAALPEPVLVEEPVAAAIHYVTDQVAVGQFVGIYDLGGGTFDTAVLQRTDLGFEVVGTPGGDEFIGGEDFDHRLYRYFGECLAAEDPELWEQIATSDERKYRRAALDLLVQARRAKEALSTWTSTQVFVPIADRDLVVNRSQFEAMIVDDIERTIDLMDDTLDSAGLTADDLAALYLVGGSSRLPIVVQLMSDRYGAKVTTRDEPKGVVALGAATLALALLGAGPEPTGAPPPPTAPLAAGATPPTGAPLPAGAPLPGPAPTGVTAAGGLLPPPQPSGPTQAGQHAGAGQYAGAGTAQGTTGAGLPGMAVPWRRIGDRLGERARAMLHALTTTPPAPAVQDGVDLFLAPLDQRNPDVRWRLQLSRQPAQPVSDGEVVVFGTTAGEVHGLAAVDGRRRWLVDVGAAVTTPVALSGDLVVAGGADGLASALDVTGGGWRWRADLGAPLSVGPVVLGTHAVVATTAGTVTGIDVGTGQATWSVALRRPIAHLDAVSSSTGLLVTDDGLAVHFVAHSGVVVWQQQLSPGLEAGPALEGTVLVVPLRGAGLAGIDVTSGTTLWRTTLPCASVGRIGHSDGVAYVAGSDAHVRAVQATTGWLRWRLRIGGPTTAGTFVVGNVLHLDTGEGEVRVVDLARAAVRWRVTTGMYNRTVPVRAGAMVITATPDAQIYGLYDGPLEPTGSS